MSDDLLKNSEMTTEVSILSLKELVEKEANEYYNLASNARSNRWSFNEEPVKIMF
jgi:hypothetical protein